MTKRQKWSEGDVFLIPLENERFAAGQVLAQEKDAMNSAAVALLDQTVAEVGDVALDAKNVYSILLVTRELLDAGVWRIVGNSPVQVPPHERPYESLRESGFVGAKIYGGGIVTEFVNAYYGLVPWDDWKNPAYLDQLLVGPEKKPTERIVYKTRQDETGD